LPGPQEGILHADYLEKGILEETKNKYPDKFLSEEEIFSHIHRETASSSVLLAASPNIWSRP